jgi:hypothetical protein
VTAPIAYGRPSRNETTPGARPTPVRLGVDGTRTRTRAPNVEAIVVLTRGLLPQLARSRGGIINIASQMAFQPMPYFASYAAS